MQLAGLKVVMEADFTAIQKGFQQADSLLANFAKNANEAFKQVNIDPSNLSSFTAATNEVVQAQKEAVQEVNNLNNAWRGTLGTSAQLTTQNERYKEELRQVRTELKLQSATRKDAYGNVRSVSSAVVELRLREQQLKEAISQNSITLRSQSKEFLAAEGSMQQMNQELGQMRTLFRQLSAAERSSPFGSQLQSQIKQVDAEMKRLDASIGNHQRNVGNYASAFNPLNNSITQITRELPAFTYSMQTGFLAISNNIGPLVDSINQLKTANAALIAQGKPAQSTFKAIGAALFSWQTLISIGVTLLTVYGAKIVDYIRGTEGASEAAKKLKEYQDGLNNAVSSANGEAATQISRIRVLNDTMTNANLTMRQRKDAYDEAVKLYPNYLNNLKQEDALTGGLAKRINDDLVPAIMAAARARAYEQKIQLAQSRIIELEQEQIKNIKERTTARLASNSAEQRAAEIARLQAGSRGFGTGAAITQARQEENALNSATDAVNENAKARIALQAEISNYAKGVQRNLELTIGITDTNKDASKSIEGTSDSVSELSENVDGLNGQLQALSNITFDGGQIRDAVQEAINIVDEANRSNTGRIGIDLVTKESVDRSLKEAEDLITKGTRSLAQHLRRTITSSFSGIGGLIASALTVENFDFISGLLDLLGSQLQALGEYLIEIGVVKAAIDTAIQSLSLTGVGAAIAVAAGVAAVALGQVLQNEAQKRAGRLGRFADGGVVYGPTTALIGEYSNARSNPEIVAPLSKLSDILRQENARFGSGNLTPVVLETRVSGQDLLLVQDRAKNWRDR